MFNVKTIAMKTVLLYFVSMLISVQVSSQELKAAFDAIGKGDVETLSGFFGNQVEVCINERVDLLPKTAAINAFKPGRTPIYGSILGYIRAYNIPPSPPNAEPIANAINKILNDKDLYLQLKQNCLAAKQEMNWFASFSYAYPLLILLFILRSISCHAPAASV